MKIAASIPDWIELKSANHCDSVSVLHAVNGTA